MGNSSNISRASRRLRLVFTAVFFLIPIINALVWIFVNEMPDEMQKNILPHYARLPLPAEARLLGFIIVMIPSGIAMYGNWVLIRLFRLYEMGQIFSDLNVRCFRDISRILMVWCAAVFLTSPLLSIALTLHHPPGQRLLVIGLRSMDITALLVGFVLAVIAWVMEEGRKLQEEQDLTI
ncbi:MAG: DUF2975 domain-containing protein [Syntrophobacter sp.]